MKRMLCALLLCPWAVMAQPKAVVFIDSAEASQSRLAEAINEMLFYSPTLRSLLEVEIFDINSEGPGFSGGLNYVRDRGGNRVSQYRPPVLPFLICNWKRRSNYVCARKDVNAAKAFLRG